MSQEMRKKHKYDTEALCYMLVNIVNTSTTAATTNDLNKNIEKKQFISFWMLFGCFVFRRQNNFVFYR